jgi:uncharacterized protein YndB with AHSA1/START domain
MIALDETTLEIERLFAAPPARVFDAWMNREEWQAWIGPEGMACEVPLLEPRVGGRYQVIMHMAGGGTIPVAGTFQVIDAPRRLVFTWGWENEPDRQSLITLTFASAGDGQTRFVLRQEGLGTAENRDNHRQGWNSALNKLDAYLGGRTSVPRPKA